MGLLCRCAEQVLGHQGHVWHVAEGQWLVAVLIIIGPGSMAVSLHGPSIFSSHYPSLLDKQDQTEVKGGERT